MNVSTHAVSAVRVRLAGWVTVGLMGCALGPSRAAQPPTMYTVTEIDPDAEFFSEAVAINELGDVLVNTSTQYLWSAGDWLPFVAPPETKGLLIHGLGPGGELVGELGSMAMRGRPGAYFPLGGLELRLGGTGTVAYAVSPVGVVVGVAPMDLPQGGGAIRTVRRAVRWAGTKPRDLGTIGGPEATALAVNLAGHAAGWSTVADETASHATFWGEQGPVDLHTLGVLRNSRVNGLNDQDVAVGTLQGFTATQILPFIWRPGTGMEELPSAGYSRGAALGINNRGQIVGVLDGSAILWEEGKLVDLQTRIPANAGWDLDSANAINDQGWIVGLGRRGVRSAVLLRPVGFETNACARTRLTVEVLGPADDQLRGDDFTSDPVRLARGGWPAAALAADGTSRVLLRFTSSKAASLTASLRAADGALGVIGRPEFDGWLTLPGERVGSDRLALELQSGPGGFQAFAVYHAPLEFARPGGVDDAEVSRLVRLRLDLSQPGCPDERPLALMVVRPPIVVMHGVWSNRREAFGGFEADLPKWLPGLPVFGRDYPNDVHLAQNRDVLRSVVDSARATLAYRQILVRRFDVIAHSMGGILSRRWAGDPVDYRRADNHGMGDIHKLITIDSPHYGSFLADYLDRLAIQCSTSLPLLRDFMGGAGMQIDRGAAEDLRTFGAPILGMNLTPTTVPSHVMVGSYALSTAADEFESYLGLVGELADYFKLVRGVKRLFCPGGFPSVNAPADTDLVVSFRSQAGGMPVPAMSRHDHQHSGAANHPDVVRRAVELLNLPTTAGEFARFPVGAVPPESGVVRAAGFLWEKPRGGAGLQGPGPGEFHIASPMPGTVVTAGRGVTVTVETAPSVSLDSLLVGGRGYAEFVTNAPWTVNFQVPTNAVGPWRILAAARDVGGQLWRDEVTVQVQAPNILDTLEITPDEFLLRRPGEGLPLTVFGVYRDGVRRNLTAPGAGTTYESDHPEVAMVSAEGVVMPVSDGSATITARHGVQAAMRVRVALLPSVDLGMRVVREPAEVWVGVPALFRLQLTNAGPDSASGVVVRWMSAERPEGQEAWFLDELPAGAAVEQDVGVSFDHAGAEMLTVSANASGAESNPDDNWVAVSLVIGPEPRLEATRTESGVRLTWSGGLTGFRLESAVEPETVPADWREVAVGPVRVDDRWEVNLPADGSRRCFRLRRDP